MEVAYTRRAAKDLKKLDRTVASEIAAQLAAYANGEERACNKVKPLRNEDGYRIRIGDYRAIFTIEETGQPQMVVHTVGHRRNIYD
ncbi:mRNA interferase RelE/StbE [Limimonas halophila]|uniref:mRNA interferase RelE/StbE n=1 Tax=Limimonas halophila TaxID=1082479 RepID=A0A1G7U340_9PROT|nr:type II toxin-antitoxin system RelE/ParE family toxin [Limimonas halophila]SDG41691.1 mRNA interferase RelE/StbE [Limimonas halophila]